MVEKLLNNKKADTIIQTIMDFWCMNLGFPTSGFFADNGREFANMKMDEFTSKLGIMVKFSPAYSPWSNGINERNHASADLKIKKMIEEKRSALTDSLVKAAAWTHNTSVNKLGYSPMQLMTGKSVTLPGLTIGNVASDSVTDAESERTVLEKSTRWPWI